MAGSGGALLSRSLSSSNLLPLLPLLLSPLLPRPPSLNLCPSRTLRRHLRLSTATSAADESLGRSLLLERLHSLHLKETASIPSTSRRPPPFPPPRPPPFPPPQGDRQAPQNQGKKKKAPSIIPVPASITVKYTKNEKFGENFEKVGLMGAVREMGIGVPTEIQCIGIPAVLEGRSVVLGSHTGSGKTLAYTLPVVQLLRCDEELHGIMMKPKRPRAVVPCPTRELSEQVFRVAKSKVIMHDSGQPG